MGLSFGMSAVQSAKRNAQSLAEPILTANASTGRFSINGIVSRVMGLIPGDSVQFLSTVAAIDAAIAEQDSEVMEWCAKQSLEFGTEAARNALLHEFATYAICKGVAMFEPNGDEKMAAVRMPAEQKLTAFELNKEIIAAELGKPVEEITVDDYNPTIRAYTGSRTSSSSNLTGIGLSLSFSDSTVWAELKTGLEDPSKMNRVFSVDLETPFEVEIENGKIVDGRPELVTVKAYRLTFKEDTVATSRK